MAFVFEEEKFDYPSVKTTKSVVFCTTPRCGSNMLCFSLIKTGLLGVPLEYFNHVKSMHDFQKRISDSDSVYDYINALLQVRTTPNGVFSMKLHHHQFRRVLKSAPLHEVLPNCKYVYLHRRDKIRQAISAYIAYKTDQWFSVNPNQPKPDVEYSFVDIKKNLMEIVQSQKAWGEYFKQYRHN